MATGLAIVKERKAGKKPTPRRERIVLIETTPQDHWFVRTTTPSGRAVWYLRFEVTGQNPRLFGPFISKRDCLLFLDDALNARADFEAEVMDACEKRIVKEECHKIWHPIVEYPMLGKLPTTTKKGR